MAPLVAGQAQPQQATVEDVYTVANVNVDMTRATAAEAREEAMDVATREAFAHLLRRLVPADFHDELPRVNDGTIAAAVSSLQVQRENMSADRYVGRLAISFRPEAVRSTLDGLGVPYAEARAAPVIVIPIYDFAGSTVLWEDPNPWRGAWEYHGPSDGLVPTLLPEGDLSDTATLSARQALSGDRERLLAVANRHGASGALVALARHSVDPRSGRPVLRVGVTPVGPIPLDEPIVFDIEGEPGDDVEILAVEAAERVIAAVQEPWKRRNLAGGHQALSNLEVRVAVGGLSDLVEARRRLREVPYVARTDLVAFSVDAAMFRIYHTADPDTLDIVLDDYGLVLTDEDGEWRIRVRDRGLGPQPVAPGEALGLTPDEVETPDAAATQQAR